MAINNTYWWDLDKGSVNGMVVPYIESLKENQPYHEVNNARFLRLYGNTDILGLGIDTYSRTTSDGIINRISLNVCQSTCDTLQAKIAKNKPRPQFLTDGGDFNKKIKAKKLNKFVEGQFYSTNLYQIAPHVLLDSFVFGTGIVKHYIDNGKVVAERVFPNEIIVDDADAIYCKPQQLHQTKYIHREVLKRQFPRFKQQIDDAQGASTYYDPSRAKDMIAVYESWHLATRKGEKNGRHVICIRGADLVDEVYTKDFFPFTFIRYTNKLLGFFGQGIVEQLQGIQLEINKTIRNIQRALHLCAVPRILVEKGSGIVPSHLNNEIGSIIFYTGTRPSFEVGQAVPPELFKYLEFLIQKAYELVGISMLSAQSKKPAGLDAGVALREYQDIESERFMMTGFNYEQFFLDSARQQIDLVRDLFMSGKDSEVKIKGESFLDTIKWSDIDLDEDAYIMQCFPTNLLPSTPSGKLQTVIDMIQGGFLEKDEALKLLDFPDVKAVTNLKNAASDMAESVLDKMIEEGVYTTPEPYFDLQLTLRLAQQSYLKAKLDNVPEDRLDMLRRFMDDVMALADAAKPPQPPVGAAPTAAVPEALPTTEMLPQQPA